MTSILEETLVCIRECLKGLIELQINHPMIFQTDMALMEPQFIHVVDNFFIEDQDVDYGVLISYVRAIVEVWVTMPWDIARLILIPLYIGHHCCLVKFVPKAYNCTILCPIRHVDPNCKTLDITIKSLAITMSNFLKRIGVQRDHGKLWKIFLLDECAENHLREDT